MDGWVLDKAISITPFFSNVSKFYEQEVTKMRANRSSAKLRRGAPGLMTHFLEMRMNTHMPQLQSTM